MPVLRGIGPPWKSGKGGGWTAEKKFSPPKPGLRDSRFPGCIGEEEDNLPSRIAKRPGIPDYSGLVEPSRRQSPAAITAIGLFKLLKGVLLVATGVGALSLLHKDVAATVQHWLELLRVDPDNELMHRLLSRLLSVSPRQLKEIGAGTFVYAALLLTEGVGLLLRRSWAEYFTVITTAGLIPLELYELAKRLTATRLIVLAVNIAIVMYLVWRIRDRRGSVGQPRKLPVAARS